MGTIAPTPLLICPQGHGPGLAGMQFCNWCGIKLVAPLAPGQAPPAMAVLPQAMVKAPVPACSICGGNGSGLQLGDDVCTQCGWLRPLLPGYVLDRSVFLWAQDGQAMTALHKISTLMTIARSVSDKVGRPWIEATFNGIRLGPRQLPDVWKVAILAARIMGLGKMPDVYVSGDQMWNSYTFGSDNSSFIILGTSIVTNFHDDELLFMLAREMGHCKAGHALWMTVIRFLAGDVSAHSSLMSGGVLGAINPTKLLGNAVEMPLMAWARQSEVTADRAGLLAVGDETIGRRALLAWSIRSANLLKKVNIEEWMKQEEGSADKLTHFSEVTTSSSMYTTRRLRLLGQSAREPELMRWSQSIQSVRQKSAVPPAPAAKAPVAAATPPPKDSIRVVCAKCKAGVRVPLSALKGKTSLNVRCPQCQTVFTMRQKPATPQPAAAGAEKQSG